MKKTSLLVDCLRDSCHYGDVMTTLVSTTRAMPAPVMCEGVKVMVEMWVRGKMELATHQPDSEAALQWRDRSAHSPVISSSLTHQSSHPPSLTSHVTSPQDSAVSAQPSPLHQAPLHQAPSSHSHCRVHRVCPLWQPGISQSDCSRP